MTRYDAIILAGGAGTRLGGVCKPLLTVSGTTLLQRVLAAVASAQRRIVVGDAVSHDIGADVVTCEEPPRGGPVAAVAAGLTHVRAPYVAILAADLPFLTGATIDGLLGTLTTAYPVAVVADAAGCDQLLLAVWTSSLLRERLAALGSPAGRPVRLLFDGVAVARLRPLLAPGAAPPWLDCDTEDDLRRAREWT
ncbi:MAG: NTP transferase domain-containing protein [Actinomycetota bacterium]|nr:NTP transferase domain-containing protein [Actinomycetota bacterium]